MEISILDIGTEALCQSAFGLLFIGLGVYFLVARPTYRSNPAYGKLDKIIAGFMLLVGVARIVTAFI